jgi:hypothetical protein
LRKVLATNLYRETGLRAEVGSLHLDLTSASLCISNLTLENPPGFGDGLLLSIPEIFVQVRPATNGADVAFKEIRFHLAVLNVVRNPAGQFNLTALEQPIKRHRARRRHRHNTEEFGGIDRISVSLGTLNYIDLARPKRNKHLPLDITDAVITNLQTEDDVKNWARVLLSRLFLAQVFRNPPTLREFWNWLFGADVSGQVESERSESQEETSPLATPPGDSSQLPPRSDSPSASQRPSG